ncbi:hypothetical protein BDB00DRAFT_833357 [Zychaea mexicana]|uniref:uncharacterized protein n=1 Tax=Zychaea mexicana TaxID=64656 RepID=UPI0022FE9398|nr:uncharacterized protein BDB00DRAFT_833357 [Zychaea mexicana]KAI9491373.1 hypothetical protein BDB00DRAFT_833357 [Zychaea mexicana]
MPLGVHYLISSPGNLLRQILAIQVIMAFSACFLIFITTNTAVYRDASVYYSERQSTPITIILSAKAFDSIAFIQQTHRLLPSNGHQPPRPRIAIYTTNVSDDDGQMLLDVSEDMTAQQQQLGDNSDAVPMETAGSVTTAGCSRSLLVKVLETIITKKQYDDGIVLWIDPTVTLANAHLLRELPSLVLQNNNNAGIWAPKSNSVLAPEKPPSCSSGTLPRIVGFDASNKMVVKHLLTKLRACEQ